MAPFTEHIQSDITNSGHWRYAASILTHRPKYKDMASRALTRIFPSTRCPNNYRYPIGPYSYSGQAGLDRKQYGHFYNEECIPH